MYQAITPRDLRTLPLRPAPGVSLTVLYHADEAADMAPRIPPAWKRHDKRVERFAAQVAARIHD